MTQQYKTSCELLGIPYTDTSTNNNFYPSTEQIKRQYRLKALQYHPDKNKSPDAAEQFQKIHGAYEYLLNHNGDEFVNLQQGSYSSMLQTFLSSVLGKGSSDNRNKLFTTILQRLSSTCEATLISTLDKLDKNTLVKLYELLKKHWQVLHIHESILTKIEQIIISKHQRDECIVLNPTIDDLFENNLYKLSVGGFQYIVPLWHHELVYDNSGNDVIVKCFPILDENIYIDEMNHLHVEVEYTIQELWAAPQIVIPVGSRSFTVLVEQLRIVKYQTITIAKSGISCINIDNVYDVSDRGNVFIHIEIVDNLNKGSLIV